MSINSNYRFDKQFILDKTNQGLDVILDLYPNASPTANKFPKFILTFEQEKTPSSIVYPPKPGKNKEAIVKSFSSGRSFTCFDLVMEQFNLEFYDACKFICDFMNLTPLSPKLQKSKLEIIEFDPKDEKDGNVIFEKTEITQMHLETLGPLVTKELVEASPFNLVALKSFSRVKTYSTDLKKHKSKYTHKFAGKTCLVVTKANENYPIMMFDFGSWQKIYQPLNADKSFRFQYAGKKPQNFIFGLAKLEAEWEKKEKENKKQYDNDVEDGLIDPSKQKYKPFKFDDIIIGSGERDCINLSSLGYNVVWHNSETAEFPESLIQKLQKMCKNLYQCFDIDATGEEMTAKFSLQHIGVKIIRLPQDLKKHVSRGKNRKDITDWVMINFDSKKPLQIKHDFKKIVDHAVPTQFWDYTGAKGSLNINNKALFQFMEFSGFRRFKKEESKEDFDFVRLKDNILEEVSKSEIENYPSEWLAENLYPIDIYNYVVNSTKINHNRFKKIKEIKPIIKHATPYKQLFFFEDNYFEVGKEKIQKLRYEKLEGTHVWKKNIKDRNIKLEKSPFRIFKNEDGSWNIEILHTENKFFNYLINTSRLHWREFGYKPYYQRICAVSEEIEDVKQQRNAIRAIKKEAYAYQKANQFNLEEEGLTDNQIYEQKLSLINKIFAFGFLLHEYKYMSKAWFIFAMDNALAEVNTSNGGTGKSLGFNFAIKAAIGNAFFSINAADDVLVNSQFLYDGININTKAVCFDDASRIFPIRKVYNNITGSWHVNPKYDKAFTLDYADSPKVVITSNFGLLEKNSSTTRRILFCPFSDYYHANSDTELYEWKVSQDVGGDLFSSENYEDTDWNHFFTFVFEAIQFQMNQDHKIEPPLENVDKRNIKENIGTSFESWAETYFTEDNLNTKIVKDDMMTDYSRKWNKIGSKKFKEKLSDYCKLRGWVFNPQSECNTTRSDKTGLYTRITEKVYDADKQDNVTKEMIYIRVSNEALQEMKVEERNEIIEDNEEDDGLPF